MKNYLLFLAAFSLLLTTSCNKEDDELEEDPNAETVILGNRIDSPTTLEDIFIDPDKVDYIITGTFTINAELTLSPGIRFQIGPGANIEITSSGSLNALGTENRRIIFEGEQPSKGFWNYIRFRSNNPKNVMDYCTVLYGGGNSNSVLNGAVLLEGNSQLAITNTIIAHSANNGLKVRQAENRLTEFNNNTITDCTLYPITILAPQLEAMNSTNNFNEQNGFNYIQINNSDINTAMTIPRSNGYYLFSGNMTINGAVNIEPGSLIAMGPGSRITVSNTGSLVVKGEPGNRIKIEGQEQANGYWEYLRYQGSNSPNNLIEYTDISYGGGNSNSVLNGSVLIDGSRLAIGNSSITNSQFYGLKIRNGGMFEDLGNNVFENNNLGDIDGL